MFAVTDVSLGGTYFHNARVYLKFVGDTSDIHPLEPAIDGVSGYKIAKGEASLTIVSGRQRTEAKFISNQLIISLDTTNGGGGFSSMVGADHHFEPAYPLAIDGSSIDHQGSDLVTPRAYTGHAWSCIGFPSFSIGGGRCADPSPFPLKTDRGDFLIYQPYFSLNTDGTLSGHYGASLNIGIFSVMRGRQQNHSHEQ
jgi:hypothetical protein